MSDFWYRNRRTITERSASKIMQLALEVTAAKSVIDVGCGTGTWLAVATKMGVKEVCGMDGQHVPLDCLDIQQHEFVAADLSKLPVVQRRFDMAISLEVAEHLPESSGLEFVKFLCDSADNVLFSAAIPGQGGNGHINEQPQTYWAHIFATFGYTAYDFIRAEVWDDTEVLRWYQQNTILYSRLPLRQRIEDKGYQLAPESMMNVVHPSVFNAYRASQRVGVKKAAKQLVAAIRAKFAS